MATASSAMSPSNGILTASPRVSFALGVDELAAAESHVIVAHAADLRLGRACPRAYLGPDGLSTAEKARSRRFLGLREASTSAANTTRAGLQAPAPAPVRAL
jgi:hypothetical protein